MSIKIHMHPILIDYTNGLNEVYVNGQDVGECINNLELTFPGIKLQLCGNDGKLFDHIDIYVNSRSCYPEELEKTVTDGDELHIVTLIGGG